MADGDDVNPGEGPAMSLITIEDFSKVKLRTAEVMSAEEIPKADKLLLLKLKMGGSEGEEVETKQIVAGIKQHYKIEEIVGKTIIIVNNLQPTKLRGVDSNGMLLAVRLPDGGLSLLTTDKPTPSGLKVG
jgi:methionyl-tRNA synthetase